MPFFIRSGESGFMTYYVETHRGRSRLCRPPVSKLTMAARGTAAGELADPLMSAVTNFLPFRKGRFNYRFPGFQLSTSQPFIDLKPLSTHCFPGIVPTFFASLFDDFLRQCLIL